MKIHWRAVLLAYSSLLLQGLSDNVRGPLFADILHDFSLSDLHGSWMFALSSFASFIGCFLTAKLIVRQGRLRMFRISVALLAIAQFWLARSHSFFEFLMASAVFGAAIGIMGVLQSVLIAVGSPRELQSRLMSGLQSMYATSSLLAPLLIYLAVHYLQGGGPAWRMTFLLTGGFSTLLFLLTYVGSDSLEQGIGTEKEKIAHHQLPLKEMTYLGCTLALYVLSEIMVSTRAALFARREHGFSLSESATVVGGFFVFMLIGRVTFSFLKGAIPFRRVLQASLLGGTLCVLLGLWSSPWFLAVTGLFMAPFYPMYMVAAARLFQNSIDVAMSIAVGLSFLFSMSMHLTVGRLTDTMGLREALLIGPFACVIAAVMLQLYGPLFGKERALILENKSPS
jgi:MFS family permease